MGGVPVGLAEVAVGGVVVVRDYRLDIAWLVAGRLIVMVSVERRVREGLLRLGAVRRATQLAQVSVDGRVVTNVHDGSDEVVRGRLF